MKLTATAGVLALSALSTVGAAPVPLTEADKTNLRRLAFYEKIQRDEHRGPVHVPPPKQVMEESNLWGRQGKQRRIRAFEPYFEPLPVRLTVPAVDMDVQKLYHVSHAYGNVDKAFDVSKSFLQSFHL